MTHKILRTFDIHIIDAFKKICREIEIKEAVFRLTLDVEQGPAVLEENIDNFVYPSL